MRLERETRDIAASWQSSRQLRHPLGEGGLSSGSNVEDMRNRLRALGASVWGTKAQLWPRHVHAEARRELQKRDEAWLADRARVPEAGGQGELRVPRAPDEPSAEERARHEVTHLPYQPWCAWCVMCETALAATSGRRQNIHSYDTFVLVQRIRTLPAQMFHSPCEHAWLKGAQPRIAHCGV